MPSGRETLRNALLDFTASLSQGAAAQAQFPGARGNRAGMAAAIAAPVMRRQQLGEQSRLDEDREMKMAQFRQALQSGQTQQAMQMIDAFGKTEGPQMTVQNPSTVQAPIGDSLTDPTLMGAVPPPQNMGTRQLSMGNPPPVQVGGQQVQPQFANQIREREIQNYRQQQQVQTDENIRQTLATRVPATPPAQKEPNFRDVVRDGKKLREYADAMDPTKIIATVEMGPAEQAAADRNQQFRDVEKGGKVVRDYFDGSDPSKVTFSVDMGSVKDKSDDPLTNYQRNQTFLNISNKYQADPIVNVAIKGQTAKAIADQIIANPEKATNQLAALYLYVKNLDADSAVREGEIGLARQTQSYLQTFGTSLARVAQGQVISPAAAKELAKATKELVTAWEATAKTRTQQYKSQSETAGVGNQFGQYLAGFATVRGTESALEFDGFVFPSQKALDDYKKRVGQ